MLRPYTFEDYLAGLLPTQNRFGYKIEKFSKSLSSEKFLYTLKETDDIYSTSLYGQKYSEKLAGESDLDLMIEIPEVAKNEPAGPAFEWTTGVKYIHEERLKQIGNPVSLIRDRGYSQDELIRAAIAYAIPESIPFHAQGFHGEITPLMVYPWSIDVSKNAKPVLGVNRIDDLAKAGALIAAEIDALLWKRDHPNTSPDNNDIEEDECEEDIF